MEDYFWTAQLKQGNKVLDELCGYASSYTLAMSAAQQAAYTDWTISIYDLTGPVSILVYSNVAEE